MSDPDKRSAVLFAFRAIPSAAATASRCFVFSSVSDYGNIHLLLSYGIQPFPCPPTSKVLWLLLTSCSSLLLWFPNLIYHRLQDLP
ncbi:MAG: hypothetical protein WCS73_05670 [Lentisphaeria bacterium]